MKILWPLQINQWKCSIRNKWAGPSQARVRWENKFCYMKEVLPISNETLNQYLTVNCYRQTININVSMQILNFRCMSAIIWVKGAILKRLSNRANMRRFDVIWFLYTNPINVALENERFQICVRVNNFQTAKIRAVLKKVWNQHWGRFWYRICYTCTLLEYFNFYTHWKRKIWKFVAGSTIFGRPEFELHFRNRAFRIFPINFNV